MPTTTVMNDARAATLIKEYAHKEPAVTVRVWPVLRPDAHMEYHAVLTFGTKDALTAQDYLKSLQAAITISEVHRDSLVEQALLFVSEHQKDLFLVSRGLTAMKPAAADASNRQQGRES